MLKPLLFILIFISFNSYSKVSQWLDFTLENGHIVIPITVAGVETTAILDTGAQINGINTAFLRKNNLDLVKGQKILVKGVASVERRQSYDKVSANLFGANVNFDDVVESFLGHHSRGMIIGAGFFASFIVQIDYPNQKMRLISRGSVDLQKMKNIDFQAQKGSGRPLVKVRVGEQTLWGLLDTGSTAGLLVTRTAASRIGLLSKVDGSTIISGVNSAAITESATATGLEFGPYTLDNVPVIFPEDGETLNLESQHRQLGTRMRGRKAEAIIGYDIFKHFLLTIDYKGGHMHVGLPENN